MTVLKNSKQDVLSDRLDQSVIRLKPITTEERDKIVVEAGLLIYNGTDSKFQGYENGAWVDMVQTTI